MARSRQESRKRRHKRIKKNMSGNEQRLRLSVYRSLKNMYAQLIDDQKGQTIVSASSLDGSLKVVKHHKGNVKTAKEVGMLLARRALEKGIKKIVFDRSGYLYHGRVQALADAAREAGLEF